MKKQNSPSLPYRLSVCVVTKLFFQTTMTRLIAFSSKKPESGSDLSTEHGLCSAFAFIHGGIIITFSVYSKTKRMTYIDLTKEKVSLEFVVKKEVGLLPRSGGVNERRGGE